MKRIYRKPDIESLVGVTERAIRDKEALGQFPKRFNIFPEGRAVGWDADEVDAWVESRIASREAA